MNKTGKIILISLLSAVLGGSSGAVLWAVLKIMDLGMEMLWTVIPERAGLEHSLVYMLAVTLTGGLIIGLWQRRYGLLPEEMPQVMARVKSEGGYPYDRLHILIVSALLPLIFGGVIGPEAGLTGVIAGLCCFVGDRLKYKGDALAALAQTGICATLGVIFNAPLFGIVRNMDEDAERRGKNDQGKDRVRLVSRPVRIFIYCMGAAGGMLAFRGLGELTGGGAMGLPRFGAEHDISLIQWAWMPAIIVSAAQRPQSDLLHDRRSVHSSHRLFPAFHHVLRRASDGGTHGMLAGHDHSSADPDSPCKGIPCEHVCGARMAGRQHFPCDIHRRMRRICICSADGDRSHICSGSNGGRDVRIYRQESGDDSGDTASLFPGGLHTPDSSIGADSIAYPAARGIEGTALNHGSPACRIAFRAVSACQ